MNNKPCTCKSSLLPNGVAAIMQVRWAYKTKSQSRNRLKKYRGTHVKITYKATQSTTGANT